MILGRFESLIFILTFFSGKFIFSSRCICCVQFLWWCRYASFDFWLCYWIDIFDSETYFVSCPIELPKNCVCLLLRPEDLDDIDVLLSRSAWFRCGSFWIIAWIRAHLSFLAGLSYESSSNDTGNKSEKDCVNMHSWGPFQVIGLVFLSSIICLRG